MYGVTLSVVPIKYYPSRNEMDILKSCVVTVNFTQSSAVNENLSIKNKKLVKYVVDNYNEALLDSYNTYIDNSTDGDSVANIYDYLIITADKYKDTDELKTFCAWKKIKGHNCKVVSCGEIDGNICDSIVLKNFIKEWYEKGVEYVLLVGNSKDIPLCYWNERVDYLRRATNSDYWYVCLSSDYFADLAIGRFCINNTTDLYNIISKTINYENLTPEDTWITKNLLVAHKQNAPKKYQACCEEIRTATYDNMPNFSTAYGASDSVGGDNATNEMVVSYINEGFGIVNYRGHGDKYSWIASWNNLNIRFDSTEVNKLDNKNKESVVFSVACSNADITEAGNLLYEFLHSSVGSVAFVGATRTTFTDANHLYNKNIYKILYNKDVNTLGYLNINSHIKTINDFSLKKYKRYSIFNAMAYICGGDPSLEIWTDTISKFPKIDFTYENGTINIDTRTIEDYTITLFSQTDNNYFKKISVEGATATITNVPSSFVMSINKHNYMPLVYNVSDGDIYIQNEKYALVREIIGDNVYIGSNVTNAQPRGNVIIKSEAEMTIDAKGKTIINKGTLIEKGARIYIK